MSHAAASAIMQKKSSHMKGVLEDFSKETLLAEKINTVILSKLVTVAKDVEKFRNSYWILLCPIARCACNMLSTTKNEESVKPHMEELCYILQQCVRQAKKSKLEILSFKTCKTLVPNLMFEIQEMIKNKPKLKAFVLEVLFEPLVSLLMSSQLLLYDALESLTVLNLLLCGTISSFRDSIRTKNMILIEGLVTRLTTCGDYEVQQGITETLLRLAPTEKRFEVSASWFHGNHLLVTKFKNLGSNDFECECRDFLSTLNESLGKDASVVTYQCEAVYIGATKVFKPKSDNYKGLFLDINKSSSSITFCCSDEIHDAVLLRVKVKDLKEASILSLDDYLLQLTMEISRPFQELQETKLGNEVLVRAVLKKELAALPSLLKTIFTTKIKIQPALMLNISMDDNENSIVPKIQRNEKVSEGIRLVTVRAQYDTPDSNLSEETNTSESRRFAPLLCRNPADIPENDSALPSPEKIDSIDKFPEHHVAPKITNHKATPVCIKTPYSHSSGFDDARNATNSTACKSTDMADAAEPSKQLLGELTNFTPNERNVQVKSQCTIKKTERYEKSALNKSAINENKLQKEIVEKENVAIDTIIDFAVTGSKNCDLKENNTKCVLEATHKYDKSNTKNEASIAHENIFFDTSVSSNFTETKGKKKMSFLPSAQKNKQHNKENSTKNSHATVAQLFQDPAPSKIRLSTRGRKKRSKLPHLQFLEEKIQDSSAVFSQKRRLYNSSSPVVDTAKSENGKCTVQFNQTIKMKNSLHIEFNVTPKTSQNDKNPRNKPSIYSDFEELDSTIDKWKKKKRPPIKSYKNKNKKPALKKRGCVDITKNYNSPCLEKTAKEPALFDSDSNSKSFSGKKSKKQAENAKSKKLVGVSKNKNSRKKIDMLRGKKRSNDSLIKTLETAWSQEIEDLPDLVIERDTQIKPIQKPSTPPFLKLLPTSKYVTKVPFSSSKIPSKKNAVKFNTSPNLIEDEAGLLREKSISPLPSPMSLSISPINFDSGQCAFDLPSTIKTLPMAKKVLPNYAEKPHTNTKSKVSPELKSKEKLSIKPHEKTQPLKSANIKKLETEIKPKTIKHDNANKKGGNEAGLLREKSISPLPSPMSLSISPTNFDSDQCAFDLPSTIKTLPMAKKVLLNFAAKPHTNTKSTVSPELKSKEKLSIKLQEKTQPLKSAKIKKLETEIIPKTIKRDNANKKGGEINQNYQQILSKVANNKNQSEVERKNKKQEENKTKKSEYMENGNTRKVQPCILACYENLKDFPHGSKSNTTVVTTDQENNKQSLFQKPTAISTRVNKFFFKRDQNINGSSDNLFMGTAEKLPLNKTSSIKASTKKQTVAITVDDDDESFTCFHEDIPLPEKTPSCNSLNEKTDQSKESTSKQNIPSSSKRNNNVEMVKTSVICKPLEIRIERISKMAQKKENISLKLTEGSEQDVNLLSSKPNQDILLSENSNRTDKQIKNVHHDENVTTKSSAKSEETQKQITSLKLIKDNKQNENFLNRKSTKNILSFVDDNKAVEKKNEKKDAHRYENVISKSSNNNSLKQKEIALLKAMNIEEGSEISSEEEFVSSTQIDISTKEVTSPYKSPNVELPSPVLNVNTPMTISESPSITSLSLSSANVSPVKYTAKNSSPVKYDTLTTNNKGNERGKNKVIISNAKTNKPEICPILASSKGQSSKPTQKRARAVQASDSSSKSETEAEEQIKKKKRSFIIAVKPAAFRKKRQSNFLPKSSSTPLEDDTSDEEIYKKKRNKKLSSYLNISLSPIKEVPHTGNAENSDPTEDEEKQLFNSSALTMSGQSIQKSYISKLTRLAENWTQKTAQDITTRRCELVRRFLSVLDLEAEHAEDKIEQLRDLKMRQQKSMNLTASNFTKLKLLLEDQQSKDEVLQQQSARLQHRMKKQVDEALQTHSKELCKITQELNMQKREEEIQKCVTLMRAKLSVL